MTRASVAVLSCVALTACGGGGGGGGAGAGGGGTGGSGSGAGGVVPPAGTYQPLGAKAASSSALSGNLVRVAPGGKVALVRASGTLRRDTGAIAISDGTYTLRDPDGADAANRLTDGKGAEAVVTRSINGHAYDYVQIVEMTYPQGGGRVSALGAGGIPTQASHMPVAGKATYRGNATGTQVRKSSGAVGIHTARATVNADFAAARANLKVDNIAAVDLETGLAGPAPAQSITANGMTISGNGFSGGQVTVSGSRVGAVQSGSAEGQFYGYDYGGKIPDEVGGVYYIVGADGVISGAYVAD